MSFLRWPELEKKIKPVLAAFALSRCLAERVLQLHKQLIGKTSDGLVNFIARSIGTKGRPIARRNGRHFVRRRS